jgi:DNA-directed RNA polymerase subunit RPC12/RpoP
MVTLHLERRMASTVEVDLCAGCKLLWFDRYEDIQLSPSATLKLFGIISERSAAATGPLPGRLRCPRCRSELTHTHDIQRSTRFQYWQCGEGHGRLMTFVDFLRAKDFVRPLSPPQLTELRNNIQTINCSNCAAPIDLARDSRCPHCGSAISMLDLRQMTRTIAQLQAAASEGRVVMPPAGPAIASDRLEAEDIDALVLALKAERRDSPLGLIEAGLRVVGDLLRRSI